MSLLLPSISPAEHVAVQGEGQEQADDPTVRPIVVMSFDDTPIVLDLPPPPVVTELGAMGLLVRRVAGPDRFATAAAIAQELNGTTAYVVEGINRDPARGWPDAVSAATRAARNGDPIRLTSRDEVPGATLAALTETQVERVVIVGGESAVSGAVKDAIGATDVDVSGCRPGPLRHLGGCRRTGPGPSRAGVPKPSGPETCGSDGYHPRFAGL